MCLVGSAIMIINHLVPIVLSKMHVIDNTISRSSLVIISSFITIFAICNSFGQTIFNGLAEYFIYRYPKCFFLIFPTLLLCLSLFGTAISNVELLYVVMVTLGLSLGGVVALIPAIAVEIFGKTHREMIESFLAISSILGSILLSQLLAGRLNSYFQSQSGAVCLKMSIEEGASCVDYCNGSDCYFYTLISVASLCFVVTIIVVLLYRHLLAARNNRQEERPENELLIESDLSDE